MSTALNFPYLWSPRSRCRANRSGIRSERMADFNWTWPTKIERDMIERF
jgi:hypothetical protein